MPVRLLLIHMLVFLKFVSFAQTSGGILFRLFESDSKQTECKFFFDARQSVFVSNDGYKEVVYKIDDTTRKDYSLEKIFEKTGKKFTDSTDAKPKYYTTQVYDEGNIIYKNLRDSILIFREDFKKSAIIVNEPKLPKILWQISDEKKMVYVYECQKATTFFRGRNYTAWFTRKIPIANGPWKLHGLPGLILEFQTDDNKYRMKFVRIVTPIEDVELLHKPIKGDRIDFVDYDFVKRKRLEDNMKELTDRFTPFIDSIKIALIKTTSLSFDFKHVEFQELNFRE